MHASPQLKSLQTCLKHYVKSTHVIVIHHEDISFTNTENIYILKLASEKFYGIYLHSFVDRNIETSSFFPDEKGKIKFSFVSEK